MQGLVAMGDGLKLDAYSRSLQQTGIGCPSGVTINEVHYQNDRTDIGEFVELAGDPGEVVSGFTLVILAYVLGLQGEIANIQDEFVITGTPDIAVPSGSNSPFGVTVVALDNRRLRDAGLALLDDANPKNLCDFISYGTNVFQEDNSNLEFGTLSLTGVDSIPTGVSEPANGPITQSIARTDRRTGTAV